MSILVDSSVWIEFFRGNANFSFISNLIVSNAICTNDIILAELVPSVIFRKEYKLAELLKNILKTQLIIDWQEICDIQLNNLRHGNNNIGISDIIIAQNCIQNDCKLLSNDKHFIAMAKYIPIDIFSGT